MPKKINTGNYISLKKPVIKDKKTIWDFHSHKFGCIIGYFKFDIEANEYVFIPNPGTIYNNELIDDLLKLTYQLTKSKF